MKSTWFTVIALAGPTLADSRTDAVERLFTQWVQPDSPGCAVGVYHKDQIVYKRPRLSASEPCA